jgi:thiol-disulfide isomerase/thioredoxin
MNSQTKGADAQKESRRQTLLYAGVGAAAAIAGAGLAWWKWDAAEAGGGAMAEFWKLSFATPEGTNVAMQTLRGRPLLLNFWATWCPPCVEELPLLDGFYKENALNSWQVVGLAVDQVGAVRNFLARRPVSFPVVLAGFGGTELSKAFGNNSGGLPFSVVVGAAGQILQRRMGRITTDDLAQWRTLR